MSKKDFKDPYFKDSILVPVAERQEGWVKVSKNAVPDTYFRVETKSQKVKCLVTVLPDGYHIGWDMCSACGLHMNLCKCVDGIMNPRTVLYYYSRANHEINGKPLLTTSELYEAIPDLTPKKVNTTHKKYSDIETVKSTYEYVPPVSSPTPEPVKPSKRHIKITRPSVDLSKAGMSESEIAKELSGKLDSKAGTIANDEADKLTQLLLKKKTRN